MRSRRTQPHTHICSSYSAVLDANQVSTVLRNPSSTQMHIQISDRPMHSAACTSRCKWDIGPGMTFECTQYFISSEKYTVLEKVRNGTDEIQKKNCVVSHGVWQLLCVYVLQQSLTAPVLFVPSCSKRFFTIAWCTKMTSKIAILRRCSRGTSAAHLR